MKKINVKRALITCWVIVIATSGVFASPDSQVKLAEDIKSNRETVNRDLAKINLHQERVISLEKQCRQHHSEAEHNDLKQAKTDLRNDKAELKKDEEKLMKAHQAHIKEHEAMVKAEIKALEKVQRNLDGYKIKGDVAALTEAEKVMDTRAELRNLFTRLERARLDKDKDRWVINREFMDTKGRSYLEISMNDYSSNFKATAGR